MPKLVNIGKRQQSMADLRRQITSAARMAKKGQEEEVSWALACKWLENHFDVLVEVVREMKTLPVDPAPVNGPVEPPVIPAGVSSSVDISREVAAGKGSPSHSGKGRREPANTAS